MSNCCCGLTFTIEKERDITFFIEKERDISFSIEGRVIETGNYDKLINKPSINGVQLIGDKTSEELFIVNDRHYTFNQLTPRDTWEVEHNLDKYPSVSIVDSAGTIVVGDIEYINANRVILHFNGAFSGKAFFN